VILPDVYSASHHHTLIPSSSSSSSSSSCHDYDTDNLAMERLHETLRLSSLSLGRREQSHNAVDAHGKYDERSGVRSCCGKVPEGRGRFSRRAQRRKSAVLWSLDV
jgi:hypothetical protein